jgi:DNA modification methylase
MMKPYYDEAGITLYHGDCREIIPSLNLASDVLVLNDPPYGIEHESGHGASWQNTQIANDHSTELRDWIIATLTPRPMVIFGTWKAPRPQGIRAVLIWDKGPAFGMGDLSFPWKGSFEEMYIIGGGWRGRRDEGVLHGHQVVSWESKGRKHPHEKPVSLASHFIAKHDAPLIFDPTAGTGFALQAAKLAGRRAIGIEINEDHCKTAAERLAQGVLWGAA